MSYHIKSWQLTDNQTIHITSRNTITFRHEAKRHGCYRGISIPLSALNILKDFVSIVERNPHYFRMPVDGKVWIEQKLDMVKLYVVSPKCEGADYRFFRFTPNLWKDFIRHILPDIISFVKDGGCATDGRKSHAHDKGGRAIKSRGYRGSHSRKRQHSRNRQTKETSDKSAKRTTDHVNLESEEEGEITDYPILS